jgi:cobalamin biosynthesis Mg chelatase CobN
MHSFKPLLASAVLSLVANTWAEETCPEHWGLNHFNGARCCYGDMQIIDTDAYCCIWDVDGAYATASFFETATSTTYTPSTITCLTKIPFTATDYSSQVSLASMSVAASQTASSASNATSTSTNSGSGTSNLASVTSASATSASATSGSATSTPNAAVSVVPARGMVMGGAAVAAALFM